MKSYKRQFIEKFADGPPYTSYDSVKYCDQLEKELLEAIEKDNQPPSLEIEDAKAEPKCTGNLWDCHFVPSGGKWSPINRRTCTTCGVTLD